MSAADIKTSLYTKLSTDPTITALVGDRIYPSWASPIATLPYVVLSRVDLNAFAPALVSVGNTDFSVIQFDVWGHTSVEVEAIVAALRTALDGFTGSMPPAYICNSRFTSAFDGILARDEGDEQPLARTTLTAELIYS